MAPAPEPAPVAPAAATKPAVVAPRLGRAKPPRRQITEPLPAAVAASAPPRQPVAPSDLHVEPAAEVEIASAPSVPAPELVEPIAPAASMAPPAAIAETPVPASPAEPAALADAKAPALAAPTVPAVTADDGRRPLNVLMVASEVLPFAKTGGLADVAAALPSALAQLGHQVVVVMPRYRGVSVTGEVLTTFVLDIGPEHLHVQVFRERIGGGASVWLVDIPAL
jgi:starch synthase